MPYGPLEKAAGKGGQQNVGDPCPVRTEVTVPSCSLPVSPTPLLVGAHSQDRTVQFPAAANTHTHAHTKKRIEKPKNVPCLSSKNRYGPRGQGRCGVAAGLKDPEEPLGPEEQSRSL